MVTINMLSQAHRVKGQGVLSAHEEQVNLVTSELSNEFQVYRNAKKRCDIMHYHTINFSYFCSLPAIKTKGVAVGYVHFLPETVENSIKLPPGIKEIFYKYVIQFYKSMDYLVTVNPYFIDRMESYGIDRNRVTYIPNYVSDEKFFCISEKKKQKLRMKYHIPENKFVVLCAGQLQKRKGFFDFIALAKRMPDTVFLWAGSFAFGAMSDGYKEIKEILKKPPKNVRILGLVEREHMNGLYNVADLMFLPSFEELFPMTILESMNCKTPILLRDLDIYPNILFDYYLKGTSVEHFEEIILKLKKDKQFYNEACEMSFKGHKFYSREHVAQMWREFYTKISVKAGM